MAVVGDERAEVWLRGNLRPVGSLAAVAAVISGSLLLAATGESVPVWGKILLVVLCGVLTLVIAVLALVASRPRLSYRDGLLRVRLTPLAVEDVPVELVECFFLGSSAVAVAGYSPKSVALPSQLAVRRVGTLVMRLAERADQWQARPTFAPWGEWLAGAVVFDGRWCEPLSIAGVVQLSRRLVEAKRATHAIGENRRPEAPVAPEALS